MDEMQTQMNEAHSSVDRERTILEENRKLKQENAELRAKYEKETLENKIKILEMQNEIQTLKHHSEIAKLKVQQEKSGDKNSTESTLKEENQALKDEIETLKHQMEVLRQEKTKAKVIENSTEAVLVKENQALKDEIEALKHQMEMLRQEKTEAKAIKNSTEAVLIEENQALKDEIEALKNKMEILEVKYQALEKPSSTIPDRFFEKFLTKYNAENGDDFNESYKSWYEEMSRTLENHKQYVDENFVLIRKNVRQCYKTLDFVSKREGTEYEEDQFDLVVEGLYERLGEDEKVFLLHPSDGKKYLEMEYFGQKYDSYRWWEIEKTSYEFYFRRNYYSVLMLAIMK
ncbi:uncharacterized protein [Clytia hemisphaerica]|uniref:Uncharacterized protein n=1 Tax=Clytia hemisphaerica TaxID=252671 RepID=A0A7M5V2E3_9CNID